MSEIIIGSRGSELALWQANFVMQKLRDIGCEVQLKIIKTQGDAIQTLSFDKMEGKGFFTKEIEDALLKKEIDLAVHSHKDLPTESPKGLTIAAVSYREDPSELLLISKYAVDEKQKFSLKKNAIVGTSSARRKSQLLAIRPDVKIEDLRGNVPTRIQKLKDKKHDAIMLAAAGVERLELDLTGIHVEKLNPKEFIPAPAQGVLALQVREEDKELIKKLSDINDVEVQQTIAIERKVLNLFDGGCQLPLGVYCETEENEEEELIYKAWVSKAQKWNDLPKYFYFETKHPDKFADKMVEKINSQKSASVFITRDSRDNDFFSRILKSHGYNVSSRSLIKTNRIPLRPLPKCEWVFFSSKNAVKHFFAQKPETGDVKYGVISKSTGEELRRFGKKPDFIGYSTDTRLTGKQFSAVVGSKTVLFPIARGSMKTVQQQLPKQGQAVDVFVYETIKNNQEPVEYADILVFTSPSNVEAFFEKNKISKEQKVVAMGGATENALQKFGIKTNTMPASFDDMGLLQAVFSV